MLLKIASVMVAATLSAGVLCGAPAPAAAASVPIHLLLDGRPASTEVAPMRVQGGSLVPGRPFFEALGLGVEWYPAAQRAGGDAVIALAAGSLAASVNAAGPEVGPLRVDGPPLVPVPVPAAGEAQGAQVDPAAAGATAAVEHRGGTPVAARGEARPLGDQIAATARSFIGGPYLWGGTTPSGFDCSGLVQYVYGHFGIDLPRSSYDQFGGGQPVTRQALQPGDLVFFSTYADGASHVGIYVGNNQFVNAQSSTTGVTLRSLQTAYWGAHYIGARRYR